MKKFLAMIMALAMILSLATTAFAANGYTITINSKIPDHTYEAYQIFKGTLVEGSYADEDKVDGTNAILTNIQWGDSVQQPVSSEVTAEEMAQELAEKGGQYLINQIEAGAIKLTDPVGESKFLEDNNMYEIGNLPAGYYLIKDKASNDPSIVYTEYILEVLEDSTVKPKGNVPEVEKKIKDINDSKETDIDEKVWQDSADYDVGDIIPYKLEATLADNLENYKNGYNLVFHDFLSPGLTYEGITSVKIINPDNSEVDLFTTRHYTDDYKAVSDNPDTKNLIEAHELTVALNGIKALGGENGCKVVVEYNARLNDQAVIGAAGNPNEVYLTFSRNPYEGNDYGETPRDRVIAFTYQVIVNKVREDGVNDDNSIKYAPLSGATFTLEKWEKTGVDEGGKGIGTRKMLKTVETKPEDVFTFSGLDDGWYRLTETDAPNGYNEIDPIYFEVKAEHDEESADPKLTMLTATKTKETGDKLDDGDLGTFDIIHDAEANALTTRIVNRAGVQLPETGGIGTTIFYAAGALMVLFAVILLITKKRMSVTE